MFSIILEFYAKSNFKLNIELLNTCLKKEMKFQFAGIEINNETFNIIYL